MWWLNFLTLFLLHIIITKIHIFTLYIFGASEGSKRVLKSFFKLKIEDVLVAFFITLINIIIFADNSHLSIISIIMSAIHRITIKILNKSTENG
jgi:hypothetical protein